MKEPSVRKLAELLRLPDNAMPLLREALTHRTYSVEHNIAFDNQRLEFLGDSVLELINTDYLFHLYPQMNEGDLTKIRSVLACEKTLAGFARKLKLGEYILVGRGEKENNGNQRESTLADLFEAIIGAVYLGSSYENARTMIIKLYDEFCPDPKQFLLSTNPKGRLQEFSQRRWKCAPVYRLLYSSGLQHQPVFAIEVRLDKYVAIGTGNSHKRAEIAAAQALCNYLRIISEDF